MKKIPVSILASAVAFTCTFSGGAAYAMAPTTSDSITDIACNAVIDSRNEYYEITNISGSIADIEDVASGINVIVDVDYSARMLEETVDESPYIQGIKSAINELSNPSDIEIANEYLNMWENELNRDYIDKSIPKQDTFCVYIPDSVFNKYNSISDIASAADLEQIEIAQDQIEVLFRRPLFSESSDLKAHKADTYSKSSNTYEDVSLEEYKPLTDEQVIKSAYNSVFSIVNNDTKVARASRAKELDRVDAAAYAKDPDNFPQGSGYELLSADCANFVSQCYHEGGLSTDDEWYPYSNYWATVGGSMSSLGRGLSDYMQDEDIVFWVDGDDISRAVAGSIIYYRTSAHVGIVTQNDGREMRYSAHNSDACNKVLSTSWFSKNADFLIPCWDSYNNTWMPQ